MTLVALNSVFLDDKRASTSHLTPSLRPMSMSTKFIALIVLLCFSMQVQIAHSCRTVRSKSPSLGTLHFQMLDKVSTSGSRGGLVAGPVSVDECR